MKAGLRKLWWLMPIFLILVASLTAWLILKQPTKNSESVVSCLGVAEEQFSCWQQRYNTMVEQQSPEAAFTDFKKSYQTSDFVKTNCHLIAHVIGRAAANRYPNLKETYAHGDNFCWSGYYHGAIETIAANLGSEKILAQINSVCAGFSKEDPRGFNHYNCVHGMGHGLMAIQDDELFKALDSCDKFDGQWQQQTCYGGVFMENFKTEVNPGEHSKYLKSDDMFYPCTAVETRYQQQCYLMQTSHALHLDKNDFAKVFSQCSSMGSPIDEWCYQSLGRDASWQTTSNSGGTVKLCLLGQTTNAQQNCFKGAVKDFSIYYHDYKPGLAMCKTITDDQMSADCIDYANSYKALKYE